MEEHKQYFAASDWRCATSRAIRPRGSKSGPTTCTCGELFAFQDFLQLLPLCIRYSWKFSLDRSCHMVSMPSCHVLT
jgi:hypothetical protein